MRRFSENIRHFSENKVILAKISADFWAFLQAPRGRQGRKAERLRAGWAGRGRKLERTYTRPHSRFGCAVGGDVGVGKQIEKNHRFSENSDTL